MGLDASGSFTFTPDPAVLGTDSFTFAANDGFADSAPATFVINVQNRKPVAADSTIELTQYTAVSGSATASYVDGDPFSCTSCRKAVDEGLS